MIAQIKIPKRREEKRREEKRREEKRREINNLFNFNLLKKEIERFVIRLITNCDISFFAIFLKGGNIL